MRRHLSEYVPENCSLASRLRVKTWRRSNSIGGCHRPCTKFCLTPSPSIRLTGRTARVLGTAREFGVVHHVVQKGEHHGEDSCGWTSRRQSRSKANGRGVPSCNSASAEAPSR